MKKTVKLFGIEVEIIPSGLCALLVPWKDSEKGLTLQASLDKLPHHQLSLFAAVQAVEWAAYESEDVQRDVAQTTKERLEAIHDRFHKATQERLWREVYLVSRRRGRCRRPTK